MRPDPLARFVIVIVAAHPPRCGFSMASRFNDFAFFFTRLELRIGRLALFDVVRTACSFESEARRVSLVEAFADAGITGSGFPDSSSETFCTDAGDEDASGPQCRN